MPWGGLGFGVWSLEFENEYSRLLTTNSRLKNGQFAKVKESKLVLEEK
jgi:hypothetical protein